MARDRFLRFLLELRLELFVDLGKFGTQLRRERRGLRLRHADLRADLRAHVVAVRLQFGLRLGVNLRGFGSNLRGCLRLELLPVSRQLLLIARAHCTYRSGFLFVERIQLRAVLIAHRIVER